MSTQASEAGYLVHFVHGKESGPWGSKISRLAAVARSHDMLVESLDYAGMDDPQARADKLVRSCEAARQAVILVGSSMGGWVATAASARLKPQALFLLAPAFYLPAYPPVQAGCPGSAIEIVHGWGDDIIPFEHSVRFGREHACTVHLVNDGHRLKDTASRLDELFDAFLRRVRHSVQ
jgi:predicted esterase